MTEEEIWEALGARRGFGLAGAVSPKQISILKARWGVNWGITVKNLFCI